MAEDYRLSAALVVVIDLRVVFSRDRAHGVLFHVGVARGRRLCACLQRCHSKKPDMRISSGYYRVLTQVQMQNDLGNE